MIAALIHDAPTLTPRNLLELNVFLYRLSSTQAPCTKLAFDVGEDWYDLNAYLPDVSFLVQGQFRMRRTYFGQVVTPETPDVYPMPVARKLQDVFPTFVRGKVVMAVLSRDMEKLVISKTTTHRVGPWMIQKCRLLYRPKDYVMGMHLENEAWAHGLYHDQVGFFARGHWDTMKWDSDPGCDCCREFLEKKAVLRDQHVPPVTSRQAARNQLEWEVCSEWEVHAVLDTHGPELVARLFHPPGHFLLCKPPSEIRQRHFLEEIAWRMRRDLVRGLVSVGFSISTDDDESRQVLLDGRLTGATATKRVKSFFSGSIVSFL